MKLTKPTPKKAQKLPTKKVESDEKPTTSSTRRTFKLEIFVPPGKTYKESIEWVQKFFDYFHQPLEAKVVGVEEND